MNHVREATHRALKRMLANGPLTSVPRKPSDQQVLMKLAAAQFEPGKTYRESEVNETLETWIGTFCEPYGIDHVTLRRMLVDARLLSRTTSGSTYRVNRETVAEAATIEPAQVLADIRSERESRKRERAI